jgi:hypothetical protein
MNVSLGQGLVGKGLLSCSSCLDWRLLDICLDLEQRPWIGSVWKHTEEMSV